MEADEHGNAINVVDFAGLLSMMPPCVLTVPSRHGIQDYLRRPRRRSTEGIVSMVSLFVQEKARYDYTWKGREDARIEASTRTKVKASQKAKYELLECLVEGTALPRGYFCSLV